MYLGLMLVAIFPVALAVEDATWALALYGFALFCALVIALLAHRWYRVTVVESGADYRVLRASLRARLGSGRVSEGAATTQWSCCDGVGSGPCRRRGDGLSQGAPAKLTEPSSFLSLRIRRLDLLLQIPGSASSPSDDKRRHALGLRRRGRLGQGTAAARSLSRRRRSLLLLNLGSPRRVKGR